MNERESFTFSSTSFKYGWCMNTVYPRQDFLFLCLNNKIKNTLRSSPDDDDDYGDVGGVDVWKEFFCNLFFE